MSKIKIQLDGIAEGTRILVATLKYTIEKQTKQIFDECTGELLNIIEVENIIDEEMDPNGIIFNELIPKDNIIEIPRYFEYKKVLFRARNFQYIPFEYTFTLKDNTRILIPQIREDYY